MVKTLIRLYGATIQNFRGRNQNKLIFFLLSLRIGKYQTLKHITKSLRPKYIKFEYVFFYFYQRVYSSMVKTLIRDQRL